MMLGALITGMLFLVRIPVVRISVSKSTSAKDASYMATIIPKGLGAAVLASLPAQQGVEGGEIIQSIVFSIILCTTVFTTVLTFMVEKTFFSRLYIFIFNLLGLKNGHEPDKEPEPIIEVASEGSETPNPVIPPAKVARRKKTTKSS
jgi:hypothetical protein